MDATMPNIANADFIYDTAFNGMTVRIPADKYEQWKIGQKRILELQKEGKTHDEILKIISSEED